jgi:hypothetical protein
MSDIMSLLFGGTSNKNPYTDQILALLKSQQGGALSGMNNLQSASLNAFNPTNFLSQFLQNAGGLGALAQGSQTGQDALMRQASKVGQNAMQDVAGQFAGLGSLYSGGAAQEASKAYAAPMFQAMSQGSAQQNQLLNQLFGGAMSGLQQGNIQQMMGGLQAAGQQGSLAGLLGETMGGYGSPLVTSDMGLWQMLQQLLSNTGSAAAGLGQLGQAGGLSSVLAGLI